MKLILDNNNYERPTFKQAMILFFASMAMLCGFIYLCFYMAERENNPDRHVKELVEECKNAAMNHDFVTANQKLNAIKSKGGYYYNEAFEFVFNAEAMYICANGNDEDFDRIVILLLEIPVEGIPIFEGSEYDDLGYSEYSSHNEYVNFVKKFNQKCNTLIDLSIANKKLSLAKKIIPLYKQVPEKIVHKDKDLDKKSVMVYSNDEQKQAIEKINKAIDNGTFPNVTEHIK